MDLLHFHPFGNKHTDIFIIAQQFAYNGRTDTSEFRFGKQQNGFDSCQFPIDIGNGFFVFEIFHGTDTANNKLRVYLPGKINRQASL